MINNLIKILQKNPGLRAKVIAKEHSLSKQEINNLLHSNPDIFKQDNEYGWHVIKQNVITLSLEKNKWVDAESFENSLNNCGCLHNSKCQNVSVIIPYGSFVMMDAGARLLSLVNQLAHKGKNVSIDFSQCQQTKSYLNRVGYFEQLDERIKVLPNRPSRKRAQQYKGKNTSLMEFWAIDINNPDETIPEKLTTTFTNNTDISYYNSVFTIFSELFGNVDEHSNAQIPGFVALQIYGGKRKHIQTVVSDSGVGIATTLKPALKKHYPTLYKKYDLDDINTDIALIIAAFDKGKLSQFGSDTESGRGLGLHRSKESATKFNANLLIRQETFSLKLIYKNGILSKTQKNIGIPKIEGTHICFDFYIA